MDEVSKMLDRIPTFPPKEGRAQFFSLLSFASSHPEQGCRHGKGIASTDASLFGGKCIPCPVSVFLSSFILFSSFLVSLGLYLVTLPNVFQMVCFFSSFYCQRFFSAGLACFIVGSLMGVRFLSFSSWMSARSHGIESPSLSRIPATMMSTFEARIDFSSFFCLSRGRRALTMASGTFASILVPLFSLAVAWQIDTVGWVRAGTVALCALTIIATTFASMHHGDLTLALRQK